MDRLEQARQFAIRVHGDQQYGDKPYVHHLYTVTAAVLACFAYGVR